MIYKKIIWVFNGFILIYLYSKINISRKLSNVIKSPFFSTNLILTEDNIKSYNNYNISKNYSIKNIFFKDLYLFSKSFTTLHVICIISLWLLMFFISHELFNIVLPIIFLFTLSINEKFLCKLFSIIYIFRKKYLLLV